MVIFSQILSYVWLHRNSLNYYKNRKDIGNNCIVYIVFDMTGILQPIVSLGEVEGLHVFVVEYIM